MVFPQKILRFIQKNKLIKAGDLVLVGVSGGADSVALVSLLHYLRHTLSIQLHVAHFNHRLRLKANQEEDFVVDWCRKQHIPCTVGRRKGRVGIALSEDKARRMRLEFLIKIAKKIDAQSIALAHHQDDKVETVLMRLLRGSGLYGLRSILPKRTMEEMVLIRPLIESNRGEIEKYLKSICQRFCIDSSNLKPVYLRNKIRLKLLPLLAQEYNPQIVQVLSDFTNSVAEDYDFLSICAQSKFKDKVKISKGKVSIEVSVLKEEHPAIRRLLLRQMVEVLTGDLSSLSFDHIQAIEEWVEDSKFGQLDLPHYLSIKVINHRYLSLEKGQKRSNRDNILI